MFTEIFKFNASQSFLHCTNTAFDFHKIFLADKNDDVWRIRSPPPLPCVYISVRSHGYLTLYSSTNGFQYTVHCLLSSLLSPCFPTLAPPIRVSMLLLCPVTLWVSSLRFSGSWLCSACFTTTTHDVTSPIVCPLFNISNLELWFSIKIQL